MRPSALAKVTQPGNGQENFSVRVSSLNPSTGLVSHGNLLRKLLGSRRQEAPYVLKSNFLPRRIGFLLLCNNLPPAQWTKTIQIHSLTVSVGWESGLARLGSLAGSHQVQIKGQGPSSELIQAEEFSSFFFFFFFFFLPFLGLHLQHTEVPRLEV